METTRFGTDGLQLEEQDMKIKVTSRRFTLPFAIISDIYKNYIIPSLYLIFFSNFKQTESRTWEPSQKTGYPKKHPNPPSGLADFFVRFPEVSHYTDHMDTAQSVNANAARKLASGKLNEWRALLGWS